MRVKKENYVKDSYLHIYNHAIEGLNLFNEKQDYIKCLIKIKSKIKIYPSTVFAYCLIPNHYHFLIRQNSDKPIYRIFNGTFAGYVQYYNRKYNRKGCLFQHPLQHIAVNNDKYLIHLCLYIHYNPFKAGLVKKSEDWKFSNYLEWIGKRNGTLFSDELKKNYDITSKLYEEMIKEYNEEEETRLGFRESL